MNQQLCFSVTLAAPFEEALDRLTEALKAEGFGILTQIDVQDTFRQKLGADFRRYLILGACNPQLAYRALSARAEVGLLLPCTVTLEEAPEGGSRVRIADPDTVLNVSDLGSNPEVARVAAEARARLERVATALGR